MVLIVSIYDLNFPFKIYFKSIWAKNLQNVSLQRSLFLVLSQHLHTMQLGILRILEYSEPCHINQNLRTFRTLTYLKPVTYSESIQRFKMELFAKIVKSYNYFSKVLHLRSLTEFWIRLSLSKCSLTCRVTLSYTSSDTYYCGIVRTFCSFCIFRTLSYSESWPIQNPRYILNPVNAYSSI